MKPRKLRIMGLNSFVDEQEIDFSKLTEKGFFGIFGPTGSGKSTILDAITIAMYGRISRGSSGFINTQKDELYVNFEFEIGGAKGRRTYIVERHIKRNKKGGYNTDKALLKMSTDSGVEILCDKVDDIQRNISDIIGLTCEDFTRSVVLPQGKFNEFLSLPRKDRGKMLERIFNLEQFGSRMTERVKEVKREKESILNTIDGALSRYDGITEELYEARKKELKELQLEEERLKKEKREIVSTYEKYKVVWELQEELNVFLIRMQELEALGAVMADKKRLLELSKSAWNVKPVIEDIEHTNKKIDESKTRKNELEIMYKESLGRLNKTDGDYKNAYDRKNRELPVLIDRESKLKQAIELDKNIKELDKEIINLREEYKGIKKQIEENDVRLNAIGNEKKDIASKIEYYEKRIAEIKIAPEYRDRVNEAFQVNRDHAQLLNNIKQQEAKRDELISLIEKNRLQYAKAAEENKRYSEDVNANEKELKLLQSECPGDSELLLQKQLELQKLKSTYDEVIQSSSTFTKLQNEMSAVVENKKAFKQKLSDNSVKLDEIKNNIENVKEDVAHIERANRASILAESLKDGEACPVCGSTHHPNLAEVIDTTDINEKNELLGKLQNELNELINLENSYKIELAGFEKEESIKGEAISEITSKHGDADLKALEGNMKRLEDEFNSLKCKIEEWNNKSKEIDEVLKKLRDEKGKLDISVTSLGTEISKDEIQLNTISNDIEKLKSDYAKIDEKLSSIIKEIGTSEIEKEITRIKDCTKEEDEIRKQQTELREKLSTLDSEREKLESRKLTLTGNMEGVQRTGSAKREERDKTAAKRDEFSENREPNEYLVEIQKLIKEINDNEALLREKLEKDRNENIKLGEEKSNEEKNILTLEGILAEQEQKLSISLSQNGFISRDEVIKSLMDKDIMLSTEREIKSFEDNCKDVEGNIKRIKGKLKDNVICEEEWEKIKSQKEENELNLDIISKRIAGDIRSIENMERDLGEIKKLSKDKHDIDHILSLLTDIEKLISGNKFVEFAAVNQLKYISLEASKRLRDITRGRYALELDSNNEFVMRDDFNGGIRRPADTLSGGETFLTSLSLALALSSHIQLKGSSPLEFFFLDEGFGTLDTELLEVVISSLERLRSDRLCVGIISHVEELKSRVPVKLIVTPGAQGGQGTKVQLEYS